MKEDFKVVCYILAVVCAIASVMVTMFASGIFFVRGCVPTLTAASDKFAKSVVESIGEDFEEHSWKIGKKGGNEGAKEDDQDETSKNIEQDSAGFEEA
jgi:5,10-methenyltetrahydromethanopterin hydrogenase